jgi:hypothetical protein
VSRWEKLCGKERVVRASSALQHCQNSKIDILIHAGTDIFIRHSKRSALLIVPWLYKFFICGAWRFTPDAHRRGAIHLSTSGMVSVLPVAPDASTPVSLELQPHGIAQFYHYSSTQGTEEAHSSNSKQRFVSRDGLAACLAITKSMLVLPDVLCPVA